MDATQVAEELVAWAVETCPDLDGSYAFNPETKDQPLPDVAAIVENEGELPSDPTQGLDLALQAIEQANVHRFSASLMLMVPPDDADAATKQLQGFVADLKDALKADRTLGQRVTAASPVWFASYEPPFVEFDDTTKARVATFSLVISELI